MALANGEVEGLGQPLAGVLNFGPKSGVQYLISYLRSNDKRAAATRQQTSGSNLTEGASNPRGCVMTVGSVVHPPSLT